MNNAQHCRTLLLSDDPAKENAFAPHAKIADAIAEMTTKEDGGRAIALIGTWGSGKSTIIEMVRERFVGPGEKREEERKVFVFDAWAHQGDPLRRAFLERLIDCLRAGDGGDWLGERAKYWEEVKEVLAKRKQDSTVTKTPVLTKRGWLLLIALFFVPLGLALFDKGDFGKSWWLAFWSIVGLAIILAPVGIILWTWCSGRDLEEVLSLLLHKTIEVEKSQTVSTPQPTSVEFEKHFRDLMRYVLGPDQRRVLIVIDNLDRVAAHHALDIWATMCAFFAPQRTTVPPWHKRFWLMVPFARDTTSRLWKERPEAKPQEDPEAQRRQQPLAEAFVEKTFQAIFEVPPPVLSHWCPFLVKCLREALPDHEERNPEDFHRVYRVFRIVEVPKNLPVTPRKIKKFVNQLGSIHRQWEDEIPLPLQAVYVLNGLRQIPRKEFTTKLKSKELLAHIPEHWVGEDWVAGLAAIHLNAPKRTAIQILIEPEILTAIQTVAPDAMARVRDVEGFAQACENVISENASSWVEENPALITNAANLLGAPGPSVPSEAASWNAIWRWLCDSAARVGDWKKSDRFVGDGILELLRHRNDIGFCTAMIKGLAGTAPPGTGEEGAPTDEDVERWVSGMGRVLGRIKEEFGEEVLQQFGVKGPPETYIRVLKVVVTQDIHQDIRIRFGYRGTLKEVVGFIANQAQQGDLDAAVAQVVSLMEGMPQRWEWGPLVKSVKNRLQASPNLPAEKSVPYLEVLMMLREKGNDEATSALRQVADDGHLLAHLARAKGEGETNTVALSMLLLLQHMPNGQCAGQQPETEAGQNHYNNILGKEEEIAAIAAPLSGFLRKYASLGEVVAVAEEHPSTVALASAITKSLASQNVIHEVLDAETFLTKHEFFVSALETDSYRHTVEILREHSDLIGEVRRQRFLPSHAKVYVALMGSQDRPQPLGDLEGFLVFGLQRVDSETWKAAMREESDLIVLVVRLRERDISLGLGPPFTDALLAHARDVMTGQPPPNADVQVWPKVLGAANDLSQTVFLRRVMGLVCQSESPTGNVLDMYGPALVDGGVAVQDPEKLVLNAFSNFLSRTDVRELQWAAGVFRSCPEILEKCPSDVAEEFRNRVGRACREEGLLEEQRGALRELAKLAGVREKDLSREAPEEPEQGPAEEDEAKGEVPRPDGTEA